MDSKQIIDALTSHISLYHASIPSTHSDINNRQPTTTTSPRSSVLKWFSSLTVHHRLAALTSVDHSFVQVLIKMVNYLSGRGAGSFILLPDLPSEEDQLPSLCYRKVEGLLGRVKERDEAVRVIWEGTRLFESREGEKVEECSSSVSRLDTMTFREEMVEDVERFVEVMDRVSDGGFLRDEVEGGLGSDWVELSWLKGKGYYGIEAFVVNKMEVSLRLAWLGYCGGKRRGVKLKEKVDVVGVSANAYWRKKGFVDWWERLDFSARREMLIAILGKNAKALVLTNIATVLLVVN